MLRRRDYRLTSVGIPRSDDPIVGRTIGAGLPQWRPTKWSVIRVSAVPDWTAADLPSFAGRTAIVTGASSGLGEVTACELARVGAHVIVAVRNTGKGEAASERMTGPKTGQVEVRQLDLQDLSSVRRFADGIAKVDVLINNAGIMAIDYALTADGFERHIGTIISVISR